LCRGTPHRSEPSFGLNYGNDQVETFLDVPSQLLLTAAALPSSLVNVTLSRDCPSFSWERSVPVGEVMFVLTRALIVPVAAAGNVRAETFLDVPSQLLLTATQGLP
jgi:hypothetical protein